MDLGDLEKLARDTPRDDLPALLGAVVAVEARLRLRLAEAAPSSPATQGSRTIDADEGAIIAGTTKRWLLTRTKGMAFRRDLSRKQPRFDEAGLRRWLSERRR